MTKDKLQDGDRLTLRNGIVCFANYEWFGNQETGSTELSIDDSHHGYYKDDLTRDLQKDNSIDGDCLPTNNEDIVKVERIQVDPTLVLTEKNIRAGLGYINAGDLNDYLSYQTIWERETSESEQPKKILSLRTDSLMNKIGEITDNERAILEYIMGNRDKINEVIDHINKEE